MAKGCRVILAFLISMMLISIAEAQEKKYNQYYNPVSLIKRLSYENFKNIKLLTSAIYNYGGGESEVEALVEQYAEASALYFQNKVEESANKFTENEKAIQDTAEKLATKYKEDATKLLMGGIKLKVKDQIKRSLKGEKENKVVSQFVDNGSAVLKHADDLFVRAKYTSSIYYYRRVKENIFNMYEAMEFDKDKDKDKKIKEDMLAPYKKDIEDNKNKIYKSKEKEN